MRDSEILRSSKITLVNFLSVPPLLIILAFAPSFENISANLSSLVKWHQEIPLGNLPWEKMRILSLALAFLQDSSQLLQYWPTLGIAETAGSR